jgi:predicted N-acyltransferase
MTPAIKVVVFKTVDAVGKAAIDSIAQDGFFTYGWLKTLETSKPIDINPFYLAAYHAGKLVAFAPCFLDIADQYFSFGPYVIPFMKSVLNMSKRLRFSKNHVLLCYSPFCYRTKISLGKNLNEKLVLNDLRKEIDAICKKEKILFSSFLFVSEFDEGLSTYLENVGYRKFFWRDTFYLNVRWQNFDDYLKSLKHNIRNRIRREIKSCKENGIIIEEVSEFKHFSKTFADMFSNLFSKYHKNAESPFGAHFYESLNDFAKDKTVVFIAKKKGALVGYSICLRHDEILDVFHCGFNYNLLEKSDFVYFNISYYEPIKWAIQHGIRKMYYRWTAEDVKHRRGCESEKVYSFVKCHNRLVHAQIGNYLRIKHRLVQILR